MTNDSKSSIFALTILLAMFLQVLFAFGDQKETPGRATVKFVKAYYLQDSCIKNLVCSELKENEETDIIDEYLQKASEEASNRGYDPGYMKSTLLHFDTHTTFIDENTAEVRITGARKRQINSVFAWVARIFLIGNTYDV
ncbi:MAG: hypothetical protein AB1659_04985, partial [Thermodesulfobacteriota bacterium]